MFYLFVKVFVHNPHSRAQKGGRVELGLENDISLLNINQSVTSLAVGAMKSGSKHDVLAVGTSTNVLVYDVENNQDLFYREVSIVTRSIMVHVQFGARIIAQLIVQFYFTLGTRWSQRYCSWQSGQHRIAVVYCWR